MELTLQGVTCDISWKLRDSVKNGTAITYLALTLTLGCSLSAGEATFVLRFQHTEYLQDRAGNDLATNMLTAKSEQYVYQSAAEKAALSGSGSAFNGISLATFALAVGMSMFQSTAVGSFWSFVNMLQILSFLPIIDCNIPYNFEVFITQYLTVSQVTIPFNMLPSWMPNPLDYFSGFVTDALNDRYSLCGFAAVNFIYNFGAQIVTWLLLFLFYVLIRALTAIVPKSKYAVRFVNIPAA